ncbi:hypothetical protein P606_12085 [Comamonas thiooxydans]|nr:hypothetical protein KYG_14558 [Acidovorax sp. NO-1]KGH23650.1 hypothetical protein P606_12085 [Comamonas thiooxydans]
MVNQTLQIADPDYKIQVDMSKCMLTVKSAEDRQTIADALTEAGHLPSWLRVRTLKYLLGHTSIAADIDMYVSPASPRPDVTIVDRVSLSLDYCDRPLYRNYLGGEPGVASLCGIASRALAFS